MYVLCSVNVSFIPQTEVNNSCYDIQRLPSAFVLFGACARSIQATDIICLQLVSWLVAWLVGWLVSWLVTHLLSQSVRKLISWSVGQSVGQSVSQSVIQ